MPTSAQTFPSSCASVARSGSFGTAWTSPENAVSNGTPNSTMAYGAGNTANAFTEFLEATFPSLALPAGSTINGVQVTIRAQKVSGPAGKNFFFAQVEWGAAVAFSGTPTGNLTTSPVDYTFGSLSSPNGITVGDLNSGNFKIRLSLQNSASWSGTGTPVAGIDSISFQAAYTLAGGQPGSAKVYDGSSFVPRAVMVWDGSAWVRRQARFWNGSAWVLG